MTKQAYHYEDPLKHIKFEREKSCKGCKHLEYVFDQKMCKIKPMIRSENLKKCSQFTEDE